MEMTNKSNSPVVTKETKNKIQVDYEGKLSVKERMMKKLSESNTWIKAGVTVLRFILMLGISFVIIYPFIARIAGSFMTYEDVIDSTVAISPKNPTIELYKAIIEENNYFEALFNTLTISLVCAFIQTLISCWIGYGIAKFKFKGNKLVMALVVFTMIVPHNALSLSMKMHFSQFDLFSIITWGNKGLFELILGNKLSLTNTFTPYILMSLGGLAFKNGLYIYLMRQFFKGVPDELEESAYVDGSGVFRTFFQIILPLSIPMMITIFLFSFSWQWTDEFYAGVFLPATLGSKNKVYMMPDVYQLVYQMPQVISKEGMAGVEIYKNVIGNTAGMMIIMPLIIMYLFCQKYLVQGIERSGLVG